MPRSANSSPVTAANKAPVITVRGLRKRFGPLTAVDGLNLDVFRGEVLAVLGPNGAGKTTTVEILEGYLQRDAGDVTVLGHDPAGGPRALRERIGIVLQECGIDRFLTCRELLQQHAGFYPAPDDPDRLLALVGLESKAGERVRRLSGGQQRRLDLALGMVGAAELLFLDDPTTGFDPVARRQAWDIIRQLADGGTTVLLTTHYLDEAQALADRVVVMARGRVVAEGTPQSLAARTGTTQISWRHAPGTALPAGATLDDGRAVIDATDPVTALHDLTGAALRDGLALDDLRVNRPSLEETYLELLDEDERRELADA